jgi:hypothetical protein
MDDLQNQLEQFRCSLCREVDVGGMFSRNSVVHKWKAPWRILLLREAAAWRLCELIQQSLDLSRLGGVLGARILLRAAFETLALLIYATRSMRLVVDGSVDFHDFSDKTTNLLLGSRDKSTPVESVNVLTVLASADKRYPGLRSWYDALCESAHPNYEGMLHGYSTADTSEYVTRFASRWNELHGEGHESVLRLCLGVFEFEYNREWTDAFEAFERWIEENDTLLQASRS